MGYKMPIVCKEVVLPFANGDTVDGYKEKYGFDITDYLSVEGNDIDYKDGIGLVKLTVAVDSGALGYGVVVDNVNIVESPSTQQTTLVVRPIWADAGNTHILGGITVHVADGEFLISEI